MAGHDVCRLGIDHTLGIDVLGSSSQCICESMSCSQRLGFGSSRKWSRQETHKGTHGVLNYGKLNRGHEAEAEKECNCNPDGSATQLWRTPGGRVMWAININTASYIRSVDR